MSFHGRIGRSGGTKVKRALGVQAALEWAFRVEHAQLDLPMPSDVSDEGFGFGLEYVLLQRAALGCKVDGGQHKIGGYTHEDAEVIAATVAGIPDSFGGKRMAIRVAELARAGLTPDWMPGAVPRCVPTIVRQNQHGIHAGTVVVGTERIRVRGPTARGTLKTVDILACPVTFSPHPQQIGGARRGYHEWWQALGWVKDGLIAGGMLREIEIAAAMPKQCPWHGFVVRGSGAAGGHGALSSSAGGGLASGEGGRQGVADRPDRDVVEVEAVGVAGFQRLDVGKMLRGDLDEQGFAQGFGGAGLGGHGAGVLG